MAQLILPSRFMQQPQQPASLDQSNQFVRGAIVFPLAVARLSMGAVAGVPTQIFGGTSVVAGQKGLALATTAAASDYIKLGAIPQMGTTNFTALVVAKLVSTGATVFESGSTLTGIGSSNGSFQFRVLSDGTISVVRDNQAGIGATSPGLVSAGKYFTAAVSFGGGSMQIALDGKSVYQVGSGDSFLSGNFSLLSKDGTTAEKAAGEAALFVYWPRAFSPSELAAITENPWQVFKAQPRRLWISPVVTGPTYTLPMGVGIFASSGTSARLVVARRLAATAAGYVLTPTAAPLLAARRIVAAPAALSLAGNAANIKAARRLLAAAGAAALTGTAAKLTAARKLTAAPGVFAMTGGTATFVYTSAPGGQGPTYTLNGGSGMFLLSPFAARLLLARRLVASAGSFSAAGSPAQLVVVRRLLAAPGTLVTGGAAAGLRTTRRLPVVAASFALSCNTATFFYTPATKPGSPTYTLAAIGGALGLTGTGIGMRARRRVAGTGAQFAVTGWAANLLYGQQIVYARAPAGSSYTPRIIESQHRPTSTATARPAAIQRNKR